MAIPMPLGVSTLGKFGISVTGDTGQGPIRMPKVKYRFRVIFLGFGNTADHGHAITLNTNTCGLPNIQFDTQTIHSYNSRVYYPGKHEWQPVDLVVRDTVDQTVSKGVGAQLQRQLDQYSQVGPRAASDVKFTMSIQTLDGNHSTVNDTWTLEGAFIASSNFGDLSYESSEARTISMSIRYDNAILEQFAGGSYTIFDNPANNSRGANPLGTLTGEG